MPERKLTVLDFLPLSQTVILSILRLAMACTCSRTSSGSSSVTSICWAPPGPWQLEMRFSKPFALPVSTAGGLGVRCGHTDPLVALYGGRADLAIDGNDEVHGE